MQVYCIVLRDASHLSLTFLSIIFYYSQTLTITSWVMSSPCNGVPRITACWAWPGGTGACLCGLCLDLYCSIPWAISLGKFL